MQKQYLSILLAAAALSLTACGDDASTAPAVDSQTAVPSDVLDNNPAEIPEGVVPGDNPVPEQPGDIQQPGDGQQSVLPGESTQDPSAPGETTDFPGESAASSSSISGPVNPVSSSSNTMVVPPADEDDFKDDAQAVPEAGDVLLALSGTSATVTNDNGCVTVADKKITVTCSGDYYLSGTATDLQVLVNTPSTDLGNVGLYLNNASIKSSDAPIFVKNAEKTVIHLVAETQNTLEDGSTRTGYTKDDGSLDTAGAVIYAKDDLNIKGSGKLTVKGNYNNGIQCSNDIKVKNGEIIVTAKNNGVKGKGSVVISGGSLNITASGDGIKSDECVEDASGNCTSITEGKGFVEITGGTVSIKSATDGISAENYVSITNGELAPTVNIVAGGGQTCLGNSSSAGNSGNTGRPGGFGGMGGGMGGGSCLSDSDPSSKGIKAEKILISGGNIDVDSHDDGIHADGSVYISGGMVKVKTDDDGIHAEDTLRVTDGTVAVNMAYEGFEGYVIDLQGGVTSVNATDDGWNASGGSTSTGNAGGFGGFGGFGGGGGSKGFLFVSGGFHYNKVGTGDTDGVDSNGNITITGGVIVIECQMNGGMGGMIDSDGTTSITGGTVLGFGSRNSEEGTNYSVSFNTSSYYGGANIAFKPTFSGSVMVSNFGKPAVVSSVDGMQKQCFAGGSDICVYYK